MTSPFSGGGNGTINRPEDAALLATYLDDRTLSPEDFPQGLIVSRDYTYLRERGFASYLAYGRPFIMLRYLRPDGTPYFKGKDPYEMVRFLGPALMCKDPKPPAKAISAKGRPNVLHFEPLRADLEGNERDWTTLPDGTTVVHVESLVKAKAVHKHTLTPCVGMNGTNSYSASKMGAELIHEGTGVDFSRFNNVILFDSNTNDPERKDLQASVQRFAFKLRNALGCKDVRIARLPPPPPELGEKQWGPDDFLFHYADPNKLIDIIEAATPYTGSLDDALLDAIQDRVVFCTATGAFIDREDKVVRDQAKASMLYRTINRKEMVGKMIKTTYAFNLLLDHKEARREVLAPCYLYLGDEFVTKPEGEYYNLYRAGGAGLPPEGKRTGAAEPMILQLKNMLGEEGAERYRTYLRFLKFTADKPCTLLVLHGVKKGQGKGWATKIADRLIGSSNCTPARGKDLSSNFNAILQAKRLLIFNEYTPEGSRATALNAIKGLAGDEFLTIEPKGMDPYKVENRAGAIFTTNYIEDVPNDGLDDRRLVYLEAENRVEVPEEDWRPLHNMVDDKEAMEDFAQWLWEGAHVDYSTWRPNPLDESRQEAILSAGKGMEGTARLILLRMRHDDLKPVCLWMKTIKDLFVEEGYDIKELPATIPFASILKKGDWRSSKNKYGKQFEQAKVYIVDQEEFAKIEANGIAVRDEADRVAKAFVVKAKFDS